MIRPRPTQHIQSLGLDGGHIYKSRSILEALRDQPRRYCPCGTRLRRTNPETLCAPCAEQLERSRPVDTLHPKPYPHWPVKPQKPCPGCGEPCSMGAVMCRSCRHNLRSGGYP